MNKLIGGYLSVLMLCCAATLAYGAPTEAPEPPAPYLLAGAPSFDMTISTFRTRYNAVNPSLMLKEYRAVSGKERSNLLHAASKISENLYSSTALEQGTGKIRTLQITWLPIPGPDEDASQAQARAYMSALLCFFAANPSPEACRERLDELLEEGKNSPYYTQTVGALRYVVVDNGDKGLTFAVEPVKLAPAMPENDEKQSH